MSQVKTTTESQDSKLEERFNNRVLTRRVSRSTQSGSPVMTIREQLSQENAEEPGSSSSSEPSGQVTTRSQSIESSEATEPKKRRRKRVPGPTRKKTKPRGPEDTERETRKTTQRMSKEAREAKKAEREVIVKERLAELDELEKAVKEGSHPEYHKLTQGIEEKRSRREKTLKTRMKLVENNIKNAVEAQKKAAYDQFHWDRLALRRSMMQQVQQKINLLEQEYYAQHTRSSLASNNLADWTPPDRPGMINILSITASK